MKKNHVAIVTGASSGIGLETSRALANDTTYSEIILAVRDPEKMVTAMTDAMFTTAEILKCTILKLDLNSLDSVDIFAKEIGERSLHRVVLNAGINGYTHPGNRNTMDGLDEIWQVNFFANVYLLALIKPRLTPKSRVVCLSSTMHWVGKPNSIIALSPTGTVISSSKYSTYSDTKLAITILSNLLVQRKIVDSVAVNPGGVASDIFRSWFALPFFGWILKYLFSFLLLTCRDGAKTSVYACKRSQDGFEYISPYGQITGRGKWLAWLTDLYWLWTSNEAQFVGECANCVKDEALGKVVFAKSVDVIGRTGIKRADIIRANLLGK